MYSVRCRLSLDFHLSCLWKTWPSGQAISSLSQLGGQGSAAQSIKLSSTIFALYSPVKRNSSKEKPLGPDQRSKLAERLACSQAECAFSFCAFFRK